MPDDEKPQGDDDKFVGDGDDMGGLVYLAPDIIVERSEDE